VSLRHPLSALVRFVSRNLPAITLVLFAPAIPELLTGSTPISHLFFDPPQFALSFLLDVGLYGTGALLIREFAVVYRKGWASILLLGAAYGIAEEGFAVHTFFQPSGSPVGALAVYGHAFGVNWLWALGLSAFHATYSIALPILLVFLWFPEARQARWFGRRGVATIAAIYLAEVVIFAHLVGHGPSPGALLFFLAVVALLLGLAWRAPSDLLCVPAGPGRAGRLGLFLAGTLGFDAWVVVLVLSAVGRVPAVATAMILVAVNLVALAYVLRRVGSDRLERSEFYFVTGMLAALFVWDVPVEFSVPGILGVAAVFAYLQYRLGRRIAARSSRPAERIPPGVHGDPPPLAS